MSLRSRWWIGFLLLGVAIQQMVGCSSSPSPPSEDVLESIDLRDLGDAYRTYVLAKKVPPKKLADILPYEPGYPMAFVSLKEKKLEVFWGGELLEPEAVVPTVESDKVLAFQTKVLKEDGYVLLTNRKIKKMTPEEFKAAPKAAESSSSTGVSKPAK